MDESAAGFYKKRIVDAQQIFYKDLQEFNPDNVQADCSEFLSFMLYKLHEELKDIYVTNEPEKKEEVKSKENKAQDDWGGWNETGEKNQKNYF